jgi:superfamily II DNA or RNA helicase
MKEQITYSDWMYLPKGVLYEPSIKAALTFTQKGYKEDKRVKGYKETDDFLLIPRDFYKKTTLEEKGLSIVKRIPQFEKTALEDNIILDNPKFCGGGSVQGAALEAIRNAKNGVLHLACGKGKTVVAIKYACEFAVPTIVVVETLDLLHQWRDAIKDFVKTSLEVGIIQGKPEKWVWRRPFVVAMIQTLARYSEEATQAFREYFGLAIYDEVHHLSSQYFVKTAPMFYGKRLGLTATPRREDGLENLYYSHVGKPFFRDIQQPLSPKVTFYAFDLDVDWNSRDTQKLVNDRSGELSFPKLWGFVGQRPEFQEKVAQLLIKGALSGRKILALSHRVDTLTLLNERISKNHPDMSGLVIGAVDPVDRRRRLKEKQIVLGTMQLAKEGLDEKSLDTLFILEPFKAAGVLQQAAGRILRPYKGKKQPVIGILRMNHDVCYALTSRLRRHFKRWPTEIQINTVHI